MDKETNRETDKKDWKSVYHTKHIEKESATITKTHSNSLETNKTNISPTLLDKENWTQQSQDINIETSLPDPSNLQFFDSLFNQENLKIQRCDKFSENLHEIENHSYVQDSKRIERTLRKGAKSDYVNYEVVFGETQNDPGNSDSKPTETESKNSNTTKNAQKDSDYRPREASKNIYSNTTKSGANCGKVYNDVDDISSDSDLDLNTRLPYEQWIKLKNRLFKEFQEVNAKKDNVSI